MKLSNGEKLILLMMSEIHTKLGITGGLNGRLVGHAIMSGNMWALDREYRGTLLPTEDIEQSVVDEVTDFLDMWGIIEESYKTLSDGEKARVKAEGSFPGDAPRFRGFDFNNESDHMSAAHFYVEELGLFRSFKDRIHDTHSRTLEIYRRMYRRFEPMRAGSHGRLTVDQLISVLQRRSAEDHISATDMDL